MAKETSAEVARSASGLLGIEVEGLIAWLAADEKGCLAAIHSVSGSALAQHEQETAAARDVLAERKRQIEVEGFDAAHDDEHDAGELVTAGACYALNAACLLNPYNGVALDDPPYEWPEEWDRSWWKPQTDPDYARRDLVKAGALILAEIERFDRDMARML